jgi:hypothetical protein
MKSLSPWHTNAAVCAQAFIKLAKIRQLAKAFGVNLLDERVQGEKTANTFCLRSHCNHHHFRKKHSHEQANQRRVDCRSSNTAATVLLFAAKTRYMSVQILRP